MVKCPDCDGEYQRLSQHVALGNCEYKEPSDYKKKLLTGMLMGDGCVSMRNHERPVFIIEMINKTFLKWFSKKMGWLFYDVKKSKTAEQSYKNTEGTTDWNINKEKFSDTYRIQSMRHPWFKQLADWYGEDGKRYPADLELTPAMAKMWYVGDGTLRRKYGKNKNPSISISCRNEADRSKFLISLFDQHGFSPSFNESSIVMGVDDTRKFLEWIGEPVDGFEYKWGSFNDFSKPWHDKETLEYLYVDEGMSLNEVGSELGCSGSTISTWLRKYNLPVKNNGGKFV